MCVREVAYDLCHSPSLGRTDTWTDIAAFFRRSEGMYQKIIELLGARYRAFSTNVDA